MQDWGIFCIWGWFWQFNYGQTPYNCNMAVINSIDRATLKPKYISLTGAQKISS